MDSDQFSVTSIAGERIMKAARIVARAANALPENSSEALGTAHQFLGQAVTAHLSGDAQEEAEALSAAETWAVVALRRSPSYAGHADHDPRFAERIVADDPSTADVTVPSEDYA